MIFSSLSTSTLAQAVRARTSTRPFPVSRLLSAGSEHLRAPPSTSEPHSAGRIVSFCWFISADLHSDPFYFDDPDDPDNGPERNALFYLTPKGPKVEPDVAEPNKFFT